MPTPPPSGRKPAARTEAPRALLLGAALLALAGCATTEPLSRAAPAAEPAALCRALFDQVDASVADAGVGDAAAARVAGFPWLRLTRPLASFRFELDTPERRDAWLRALAARDAEGRRAELANLPADARSRLASAWRSAAPGAGLPATLQPALAACRERLNRELVQAPGRIEALVAAAPPPDEYRTWQRVLGLYPLTRYIVLPQIATHQAARREAIRGAPDAAADLHHYRVPSPPPTAARAPAPAALDRDALGIPRPAPAERAALFSAHAPVWAIDTGGPADRPGALVVDGARPRADPSRPVEYRQWSWTRFRGEVLVQLSYVLWFPERPSRGALDIYAGHLDGLIWRVTLTADGRPLAYESIHACGCYYTVFPAAGWRLQEPPGSEPVLTPQTAPTVGAGRRLRVRLESATHYLAGIDTVPDRHAARTLAPLPLDALRSLPLPDGSRRSAFAPDGLIPSSRRPERFLLWPLGVPSPGAMRQWGTHAIAFVGKRHFDDPFLLERLLEAR